MILLKNKWQTRQEKSKWTNLKQFTFSRICECRTHLFIFANSICTVLKILTHAADCCTKEVILCSMSQQCIVHWWAAKLYKAQHTAMHCPLMSCQAIQSPTHANSTHTHWYCTSAAKDSEGRKLCQGICNKNIKKLNLLIDLGGFLKQFPLCRELCNFQ